MQTASLNGGFAAPAHQSAKAFRAAMEVMARPGSIEKISGGLPPAPMSIAAGTLLLTLCDSETPIFLGAQVNTPDIRDWIRFHIGAPLVGRADCAFALGTWTDLLPIAAYPVGTAEYPDRSATLIVECDQLLNDGTPLQGPGIRDTVTLSLPNISILDHGGRPFPLGLDFYLTCEDWIAALPRTTRPAQTEDN